MAKGALTPAEDITALATAALTTAALALRIGTADDIARADTSGVPVFIHRMHPGAPGIIFGILIRRIIRHRTCDGNGHNATCIFRRDIRIAINRQIPGEDGVRRAGNAIVRHRRTDSLRTADADATGQIDIPRTVIGRKHEGSCRDIRILDARLRRIHNAIDTERRIDSDGLRRAARRRNAQIQRIGLGCDICFAFRRRHCRTAVNVCVRRILLFQPQNRATDALIGRFCRIQSVNIHHLRLFPKHRRGIFQNGRNAPGKIHRRDIRRPIHRHVAPGVHFRRRCRAVCLSDVRLGAIVIIHPDDRTGIRRIFSFSRHLRPAVHERIKPLILTTENQAQHRVLDIRPGIARRIRRLPRNLRLRIDRHLPRRLYIPRDGRIGMIRLPRIGNSDSRRLILPFRGLFPGLIFLRLLKLIHTRDIARACHRLGRDRQRFRPKRIVSDKTTVDFIRRKTMHDPGDFGIGRIITHEDGRRPIDAPALRQIFQKRHFTGRLFPEPRANPIPNRIDARSYHV